ncbi:MAG: sigma-70 family RNA polymerase sigma factor [Eubacterium sp.]|nr:sigma-70 family RNA polymerase sigma factor [Eubacterium sp.]
MEMTYERLEQYRTIKRQIELHNRDKDISFLSGVDTSKPSVQSGKTSDTTADLAIALCEEITEQEYKELCEEFRLLNKFIYGIEDLSIREIAKLKFIKGYTYDEIADIVGYESSTIQKKLTRYIKNH